MSKPDPIQFELRQWSITYKPKEADSGITDEAQKRRYFVEIHWEASVRNLKNRNVTEVLGERQDDKFATYDEAKAWLDQQLEDK